MRVIHVDAPTLIAVSNMHGVNKREEIGAAQNAEMIGVLSQDSAL